MLTDGIYLDTSCCHIDFCVCFRTERGRAPSYDAPVALAVLARPMKEFKHDYADFRPHRCGDR